MNKFDDTLTEISMHIIIDAGNARQKIDKAFKLALERNFTEIESIIEESEQLIVKAHNAQTGVIQNYAEGNDIDFNLLFIHAQDTLMTIITEVNLTKKLIYTIQKMKGEM